MTVAFLINRTPSHILQWQTPFFPLHHKHPDYTAFRVFGCLCFASTLSSRRSKFHPRAIPYVFLGYPPGMKSYRLLDIENRIIFVSRDVVFHEDIFPFHKIILPKNVINPFPNLVLPNIVSPSSGHDTMNTNTSSADMNVVDEDSVFHDNQTGNVGNGTSVVDHVPSTIVSVGSHENHLADTSHENYPIVESQNDLSSVPRRSLRSSKLPSYLKDYHCSLLYSGDVPPSKAKFSIHKYLAYDKLSPCYKSFSLMVSASYEPQFYH